MPVLIRAKATSYPAVSTSNMRQIYVAWASYRTDFDDAWPTSFVPVADRIPDKRILVSPGDPFPNGANSNLAKRIGTKMSYFYNDEMESVRADMQLLDANFGILADIVYGEQKDQNEDDPRLRFRGLTLRLRNDGSVHRDQVFFRCTGDQTFQIQAKVTWIMMTDARPCKSPACELLTEDCK